MALVCFVVFVVSSRNDETRRSQPADPTPASRFPDSAVSRVSTQRFTTIAIAAEPHTGEFKEVLTEGVGLCHIRSVAMDSSTESSLYFHRKTLH